MQKCSIRVKTPLYLRDLKDDFKAVETKLIKKHRPDLIKALNNEDDIEIGYYHDIKDYSTI